MFHEWIYNIALSDSISIDLYKLRDPGHQFVLPSSAQASSQAYLEGLFSLDPATHPGKSLAQPIRTQT
jgi:hypothetical protein